MGPSSAPGEISVSESSGENDSECVTRLKNASNRIGNMRILHGAFRHLHTPTVACQTPTIAAAGEHAHTQRGEKLQSRGCAVQS